MFNDKRKIIIFVVSILIISILFIIYVINRNSEKNMIDLNSLIGEEDKTKLNSNQESISNEENSLNIIDEKQNFETIVVHITGEVKKEGVIYLEKGARIIDAIKEAGATVIDS